MWWTRTLWSFIEFRIRSINRQWDGHGVINSLIWVWSWLSSCFVMCFWNTLTAKSGKREPYYHDPTHTQLVPIIAHKVQTIVICSGLSITSQAPVPLSIFRSNSKFNENSKHFSVKYTWPITMISCTRHDSATVVTCAKYLCDRSSIFETRAFWIFI